MYRKEDKYPDTKAFNFIMDYFTKKNISLDDITEIAYQLQHSHTPAATKDEFKESVIVVLHKREIMNSIMVGIELDRLADEKKLSEPLQSIIARDFGLFGVDELLAIGIANLYGTIGVTNFGWIDKVKTGIIAKLDTSESEVNTFFDDIVGAIAVAASTRVAQKHG